MLRLLFVHPIRWNGDQFVVSGLDGVFVSSAVALLNVALLIRALLSDGFNSQWCGVSRNTIDSEMNFLMRMLEVCGSIMTSVSFFVFLQNRARIASAFNELNSLWPA